MKEKTLRIVLPVIAVLLFLIGWSAVNRHATLTPFRRPIMTPLGQHG